MLARFTEGLVGSVRNIAAVVLLLSLVLNFCNVVGRYFFSAPIEWAEEVMLFLMVAIVFMGASYVSWKGRQIAMDLLIAQLPPGPRKVANLFAMTVEVVAPLWIAWLATPVILTLWSFDQRSQAADIPLAIPQALIPVGFVMIAFATLVRILLSLFTRRVSLRSVPQDKLAALR